MAVRALYAQISFVNRSARDRAVTTFVNQSISRNFITTLTSPLLLGIVSPATNWTVAQYLDYYWPGWVLGTTNYTYPDGRPGLRGLYLSLDTDAIGQAEGDLGNWLAANGRDEDSNFGSIQFID